MQLNDLTYYIAMVIERPYGGGSNTDKHFFFFFFFFFGIFNFKVKVDAQDEY